MIRDIEPATSYPKKIGIRPILTQRTPSEGPLIIGDESNGGTMAGHFRLATGIY
jgi:hypothetical protein